MIFLAVLAYLLAGLIVARVSYQRGEIDDYDNGDLAIMVALIVVTWPVIVISAATVWFVTAPGIRQRREARQEARLRAFESKQREAQRLAEEAGLPYFGDALLREVGDAAEPRSDLL